MAPARYIASLLSRWPKPKNAKELGQQAEKLAALYLRLKGYQILHRNWRTRLGEIDLIAQRWNTLIFVEVKARASLKRGYPEEAITPYKRHKLLSLAKQYLANHQEGTKSIRFDVIAIDFSQKRPQIRHYQGVIEDE